jgi:hypothetical protein
MLRKYTALVAMLVLITLLAAPLVLAQQEAQPTDGPGSTFPDNSGNSVSDHGCDTTVYPNGARLVSCHPDFGNSGANDTGASLLQYSSTVPPGYQLEPGGYACPVFDPHGPPCFRVY